MDKLVKKKTLIMRCEICKECKSDVRERLEPFYEEILEKEFKIKSVTTVSTQALTIFKENPNEKAIITL